MFRVVLFSLLLLVGCDRAPRVSCQSEQQLNADISPSSGPYRLHASYCQAWPKDSQGSSIGGAITVSPDARSAAFVADDAVFVSRLSENNWREMRTDLGSFGAFRFLGGNSIRWAENSEQLWSSTMRLMRPNGFALGAVHPVLINDLAVQRLPEIQGLNGRLDSLLWLGDEGLALALIDAKGGYYKPEREDPHPRLAMVDARRGALLDAVPLTYIPSDISGVALPDGRGRALVPSREWMVWTQGETPRMLANPYPNESVLLHLAADGRSVLVERRLSSPQHCPHDSNRFGRGPRCVEPPLEPVDDVLVALHDLKTGIPIWTLRRWFSGYPRYQVLALSDDGAFALASLPVPNSESATRLELLSMLDGEVLQTFPEAESAGFARGGHIVWARRGEMTTLYELKR